jgi:hypothetical protein
VIARPAPRPSGDAAVLALLIVALVWVVDTHRPASPPPRPHPSPSATTAPSSQPPADLSFASAAGCRPAGDYGSPRLDRRVRELLVAIARQHRVRVSCIRTGHSWYVRGTRRVSNHSVWRAVDVDLVDGQPVSPGNQAARELARWIGQGGAGVQPSEVGSPWGEADFGPGPWFSDDGHQDHLHVGFAGPTQGGGR